MCWRQAEVTALLAPQAVDGVIVFADNARVANLWRDGQKEASAMVVRGCQPVCIRGDHSMLLKVTHGAPKTEAMTVHYGHLCTAAHWLTREATSSKAS